MTKSGRPSSAPHLFQAAGGQTRRHHSQAVCFEVRMLPVTENNTPTHTCSARGSCDNLLSVSNNVH